MKISALTLVAVLTCSAPAFAASPFVGMWKMDVAKSTFTGDTMTYSKTATGYHYSNGSTIDYDFADDAKPYALMAAGRTTSWTKTGPGVWDITFSVDGKAVTKAHRMLSADGSTMTTTYEEYRPDGTTVHEKDVYTRVSGGHGLEGKWKDVKVDAASDTLMISAASATTYKIEYPTNKVSFVTAGDGTPSPVTGPTVPAGAMAIFKVSDDHTWTYTNIYNGKVIAQGMVTVSPDGAMLTDTNWVPGKETEKQVEVYAKQ